VSEQTVKCQICGLPYVVYAFYSGDQSACSRCRAEARKDMGLADAMRRDSTTWPPR
jgi:hypothetical protein